MEVAIPPRLVELVDWMNEALSRAHKRRDERAAFSRTQAGGLLIPPISKTKQDELHAELVREIEEDLKRS